MKLLSSPTSPFVRKVAACAHRVGLANAIETVRMPTADPALLAYNPLGKIPVLIMAEGVALVDSRVICEYLDGLHDGEKLFPEPRPQRFVALTRQALADGVSDAAAVLYAEGTRPEGARWQERIDRQLGKITRTLQYFDAECGGVADVIDIGTISIACSASYCDPRLPVFGEDWRSRAPRLAAWLDRFQQHSFMTATAPTIHE